MSGEKKYAEVILGLGADKSFTYSLPERLITKACPGHRVVVPLGRAERTGFIAALSATKGGYEAKDSILYYDITVTPFAPSVEKLIVDKVHELVR